jgi:hypothetical protein
MGSWGIGDRKGAELDNQNMASYRKEERGSEPEGEWNCVS